MVAVANPYAAQAAAEILLAGGHAVDAAIAAHAVLGLVEPQSSGLGGGAFMMVYERESNTVYAYDGRETAPAKIAPDFFVRDDEVMGFLTAWQSGLAVGAPGIPALYQLTHSKHGRLSMAKNFTQAISLAQQGFIVSPRLASLLKRIQSVSRLDDNPDTAPYFYPDGKPLSAGVLRDNPAYAKTLQNLAAHGPASFYTGQLAGEIVAAVQAEPNPGGLTLEDLANYAVIERRPLCASAGLQRICTMPPPSSGLAQIMILNLYDQFTTSSEEPIQIDALVDAQRLAYADRDHYIADPAFVSVPTDQLINSDYLRHRATQRHQPGDSPVPGDPGQLLNNQSIIERWGRDTTAEPAGTTHLSIIDQSGNAVSMTATIEAPFGASRWAGGFLLNNEMTDFARQPKLGGKALANAAAPGKRPRSSMSPLLIFDQNNTLQLVAGSPGGNSIVAYVAKALVGTLRGGLTPQQAADAPNIIARGAEVKVEIATDEGVAYAARLRALGYPVTEREGENSGLHLILVTPAGLLGAADSRREGQVIAVP